MQTHPMFWPKPGALGHSAKLSVTTQQAGGSNGLARYPTCGALDGANTQETLMTPSAGPKLVPVRDMLAPPSVERFVLALT